MKSTHKRMRGFEYAVFSIFSVSVSLILMFLPLAPLFADEVEVVESTNFQPAIVESVSEIQTVIEENTNAEIFEMADELGEFEEILFKETEAEEFEYEEEALEKLNTVTESIVFTEINVEEETLINPDDVVDETLLIVNEEENLSDRSEVIEVESNHFITGSTDDNKDEEYSQTDQPYIHAVTNDENRFSFSLNECVLVGDGSFYCSKPTEEVRVTYTDRVFSAVDESGVKQIYIEKNGVLTKITDNLMDDDAPYYDEVSNTIVWHRLIDGRYQILSYSLNEGKENQITFDRFNNMQPNRHGDTIVWQGWVGSDWEIFMLKGDELTMLTDNTVHDVSPSINGTHLVWQSFENGVWVMKVYDLRTGFTDTIAAGDGGSIENPRFVLVYDTKYDSGDIHTRGYDLHSGEIIELATRPVPVPQDIPSPDQTGEERALVSPTINLKTKFDSNENDTDDTDDVDDTDKEVLLIDDNDIVIPEYSEDETGTEIIEYDSLESYEDISHIEDVDLSKSDSEEVDEPLIGDLIITPFIEPIQELQNDLDSQE